jgi:hypothetical protein
VQVKEIWLIRYIFGLNELQRILGKEFRFKEEGSKRSQREGVEKEFHVL